jgi:hypothetical protein
MTTILRKILHMWFIECRWLNLTFLSLFAALIYYQINQFQDIQLWQALLWPSGFLMVAILLLQALVAQSPPMGIIKANTEDD